MAEVSVITEEMRKLIGVEMGPKVYEVEKGAVIKFAEAIEDPNPLWQDEAYAKKSRHGGIVTPPTFPCTMRLLEPNEMIDVLVSAGCPLDRLINGTSELEHYQAIRPGDVISVTGRFTGFEEKAGKGGRMLFSTLEIDYRNQRGELVVKGRNVFILR